MEQLGSAYDYLAKIILLGPSGSGKYECLKANCASGLTPSRSCLLHRFVKSEWRVLSSQTIGVEFSSKIVKVGTGGTRKRVKLQLWDTAGTERFRSVSRSYYRGAAGAILVYDVASLASFNALPTFLMDARALASPHLTVILAGNKVDLADSKAAPSVEPSATPSSISSKQSALPFDGGGSFKTSKDSLTVGARWTASTAEGREVTPDFASRWASKSGIPVAVEVSALSGENVEELFNRLARMILTKIELGEIDPADPQSGIQYGDMNGWDGSSLRSDDGGLRRRTHGKGLGNLSHWEHVLRKPGRRGGYCC